MSRSKNKNLFNGTEITVNKLLLTFYREIRKNNKLLLSQNDVSTESIDLFESTVLAISNHPDFKKLDVLSAELLDAYQQLSTSDADIVYDLIVAVFLPLVEIKKKLLSKLSKDKRKTVLQELHEKFKVTVDKLNITLTENVTVLDLCEFLKVNKQLLLVDKLANQKSSPPSFIHSNAKYLALINYFYKMLEQAKINKKDYHRETLIFNAVRNLTSTTPDGTYTDLIINHASYQELINISVCLRVLPLMQLAVYDENKGDAVAQAINLSLAFNDVYRIIVYLCVYRKFYNPRPNSIVYSACLFTIPPNIALEFWLNLVRKKKLLLSSKNRLLLRYAAEIEQTYKQLLGETRELPLTSGSTIQKGTCPIKNFNKASIAYQQSKLRSEINTQAYLLFVEQRYVFASETIKLNFNKLQLPHLINLFEIYQLKNNPHLLTKLKLSSIFIEEIHYLVGATNNDIIPDVTIDGKDIGLEGYYISKLDTISDTGKQIAACLGNITHCCHSFDSAGKECMVYAITQPNSGIYVLYKSDKPTNLPEYKNIIAEAWTWVNDPLMDNKTLCLDSIQMADIQRYSDIARAMYTYLSLVIARKTHIRNIYVGGIVFLNLNLNEVTLSRSKIVLDGEEVHSDAIYSVQLISEKILQLKKGKFNNLYFSRIIDLEKSSMKNILDDIPALLSSYSTYDIFNICKNYGNEFNFKQVLGELLDKKGALSITSYKDYRSFLLLLTDFADYAPSDIIKDYLISINYYQTLPIINIFQFLENNIEKFWVIAETLQKSTLTIYNSLTLLLELISMVSFNNQTALIKELIKFFPKNLIITLNFINALPNQTSRKILSLLINKNIEEDNYLTIMKLYRPTADKNYINKINFLLVCYLNGQLSFNNLVHYSARLNNAFRSNLNFFENHPDKLEVDKATLLENSFNKPKL